MQQNNDQINISNDLDDIIVKFLLPITNSLLMKTKELKEKKLEFRKELTELKHKKQALIQKKKRLMKQKLIHEKNLNSDFSNSKVCEELLINYINFVDKKETDFIKSKEDYYEVKIRKKQLDFNKELINLIKAKTNSEKTKKLKKINSFEYIKELNNSGNSISKNIKYINKSFSIDKSHNKSALKSTETISPRGNDITDFQKIIKKKNSYHKNKSYDSLKNSTKNKTDISKEIKNLINNYSSKKNDANSYISEISENYNDGLSQLKELNKETKNIENDLKEMMKNLSIDENE